ncbi:MAG TPA: 4Fe-4S dicluster domain-containing protein [Symbiobacteriaceae bacterium]|nr:4Fe-4S dicluster domain-containing protein [Symbiobacteriaceae bacterium]
MGRSSLLGTPARATEAAMLVDISDCIGCKACEVACKQWNRNPAEMAPFQGSYQSHPNLTASTWTLINFRETVRDSGDVVWTFQKHNCMHCSEAGCVMVCPVDALRHDEYGIVNLDFDKCIGCGYCEQACPYDAVHVDAQLWNTNKKAGKCTLCFDRITNGLSPACVQACPTDCIKYGARDELIRWGKERVDLLRKRGFPAATLYGADELGGLHQLYVLTDSPDKFGLPVAPVISKRIFIWQRWLKPIGKVLVGTMLFGLFANLVVNRFIGLKAPVAEGGDLHA